MPTELITFQPENLKLAHFANIGRNISSDVGVRVQIEFIQIDKSDDELDETPLGGLMMLFRNALPHSQLISRLEQLRPERNHCAHRALVLCFMSDVCSNISLDEEFERMQKAR